MKSVEMAIMRQKKTRDGGLVEVNGRGGGCGVKSAWPRRVNIEAELAGEIDDARWCELRRDSCGRASI